MPVPPGEIFDESLICSLGILEICAGDECGVERSPCLCPTDDRKPLTSIHRTICRRCRERRSCLIKLGKANVAQCKLKARTQSEYYAQRSFLCWVSSTRARIRNARSVRHGQRQWLFFGRASLGSRLILAPRDPSGLRSLIGQRLHYASCLKRIGDSITRAPCLKVMTVPGQRSQAAR